ncbi:MAG: transglutaminase-like domain-containing protein [Sulfuricurvum sp.]|uniref:transglutaminase-like domain-containing protein n=1 Tax=Sulfuricurvum sp. TaxID=2025608 RepID=UPI00263834F3|nr:transglutaminase-like domain-containing protein [Sulfuricurvum sp.]MDD5160170.1 transglutaminase-like domain-containing protein [Sulfuricurvum sp.]
MHRREFMKITAISGAICLTPSFLTAASTSKFNEGLALYDIRWSFDLSLHKDKECALWVPLPSDISGFQRIIERGDSCDGDTHYESDHNRYTARTFYARWDKNAVSKKCELSMSVALRDRQCDFRSKRISPDEIKSAKVFLAPSEHIPIDGAVAKTAKSIVGSEKDPLKKARKIYDWIIANGYRDESVHGCGVGSPNAMLAQLERDGRMGGKCLDMSALCVALMRASHIPAREVLGIRVGASRLSPAFGAGEDITKAQHCKVEFFIPSMGWIPCDPADITKLVLKENIEKNSPRAIELANKFFGFWENNWMAFNHARDFDLYPANTQGSLDSFGYPYAEVDGEYLDPFEPKSYRYTIRSTKEA